MREPSLRAGWQRFGMTRLMNEPKPCVSFLRGIEMKTKSDGTVEARVQDLFLEAFISDIRHSDGRDLDCRHYG
jgi:hypothetical protein